MTRLVLPASVRAPRDARFGGTVQAVHPGEVLAEWQREHHMSSVELARRLSYTPKHISEFRSGKTGLSPNLARGLELVTGVSARFWLHMQADYELAALR